MLLDSLMYNEAQNILYALFFKDITASLFHLILPLPEDRIIGLLNPAMCSNNGILVRSPELILMLQAQ
jgi:hypothetical protein